jgi:GDPmannose 4,6-dehydratase
LKTAIIIGITGQDGAYLSQLLLKKSYKVIGVTRDMITPNFTNLSFLGIVEEIEFIEQASIDEIRIAAIIKKYKPTEIYNLGAQSSVSLSFVKPYETLSYNILGVMPWLEAIRTYSPSTKFYQASSSEMFGNVRQKDLPLKESLIFRPASPYGVSKAAAHWLTINYREAYDLFCSCGILFNHESCLRGKDFVIKKLINSAVKIKLGLSNDPIPVGNTSIKRDWGYAPDYAEAMWKVLQHSKADDFLICSGTVASLNEIIGMIMQELNLERKKYIKDDRSLYRPVDLEVIYGDNTKARRELKWDYSVSVKNLIKKLITDEIEFIEWEASQDK